MFTNIEPRKRNKDKRRKKGVFSEGETETTIQRDISSIKLYADEKIHIHKEVNVGGNILSKLIFICLFFLLGLSLIFVWSEYNGYEDEIESRISWILQFFNHSFFIKENENQPFILADNEPDASEQNFLQHWFGLWSFLNKNFVSIEFLKHLKEKITKTDLKYDLHDEDHDLNVDENYESNESDNLSYDFINTEEKRNTFEDDDDKENDNDSILLKKNEYVYTESEYSSKHRINYKVVNDGIEVVNKLHELDNKYADKNRNRKRDVDENVEENNEKDTSYDAYEDNDDKEQLAPNEENIYNEDEKTEETYEGEDKVDKKQSEFSNLISNEEDFDKAGNNNDESSNNNDNEIENETTATDAITKIGVGVALIIVAYTVVIRKWNNYADFLDQIFQDAPEEDHPGEQKHDHYASNSKNLYQENKQEYLDMLSTSKAEDSKTDEVLWLTRGADMFPQEVGELNNLTSESEIYDSDVEPSVTFDRHLNRHYDKVNITNAYDWKHKEDLDDADEDFNHRRINVALDKYRRILQSHENSVRAKYGIARVLDFKAEQLKSNKLLINAIETYEDVLRSPNMPTTLLRIIAERAVNRTRFLGEYGKSIFFHNVLIDRFPNEVKYQNDRVVTLLMLNRISEAMESLEEILRKWSNDELAAVYYGFVLKINGRLTDAVEYLQKGIKSMKSGTQDSRFYFQLGDALQKLRRENDALKIYELGVQRGMFLSKYQRSLYNVNRLTARPWWSLQQTTYQSFFQTLEINWKIIRNEAMAVLKSDKKSEFREETEQLRETGSWRQFELYRQGVRRPQCKLVPFTCRLISNFQPAASCRRGQVKFSIMEPNTHVWPHCGPTNCRLRAHLGLVIPKNVYIRVANETRSWEEGKVFVFDDSFEHEVWHNGTKYRLILIVDVWHPELSQYDRRTLTPI